MVHLTIKKIQNCFNYDTPVNFTNLAYLYSSSSTVSVCYFSLSFHPIPSHKPWHNDPYVLRCYAMTFKDFPVVLPFLL